MMDYKAINDRAYEQFVESLKAGAKGSPIVRNNRHITSGKSSTWAGAGNLTLGGFIWWTAACRVLLTDAHTGVKAVKFSASGTGFMVGGIEAEVVGAFVVDPSKIKNGKCHYTIAIGAVEEGAATLFLYSTKGKLYGNFTGPAEGVAAGEMSGTGKLEVS